MPLAAWEATTGAGGGRAPDLSCAALLKEWSRLQRRVSAADRIIVGSKATASERARANQRYEEFTNRIAAVEGWLLTTEPRTMADAAAVLQVTSFRLEAMSYDELAGLSLRDVVKPLFRAGRVVTAAAHG